MFGDYEDAIDTRSQILFHSALSPFLNCGLITPREILDTCLSLESKIPINCYEGYIRQIIGWREFVKGIYDNFNAEQESANFFDHTRKMGPHWYEGNTGIDPLDDVIHQVLKTGYTHHIPRLMILGNIMLLSELSPKSCASLVYGTIYRFG